MRKLAILALENIPTPADVSLNVVSRVKMTQDIVLIMALTGLLFIIIGLYVAMVNMRKYGHRR